MRCIPGTRLLNIPTSHTMQVRLHAARPALSHRVRSASVRVHGGTASDFTTLPALYPLVACMAMCLPRLEEMSLDLGTSWHKRQLQPFPSILAPLDGLPHLSCLRVSYPGAVDITIVQAGPAGGRPVAGMHA